MMFTPNRGAHLEEMLKAIGVDRPEDLFQDIPESLRSDAIPDLPGPYSEFGLKRLLGNMASKNTPMDGAVSFLGGGCYHHYVPSAVNHLAGRSEFATAYTPYQPEVSQGTLQAIFEFQTYIALLTGMDVANASLYDGATALSEAILLSQRAKPKKKRIVISKAVHPEYRQVVKTLLDPLGLELVEVDETAGMESDWEKLTGSVNPETACVVVQNPNFFGTVEDLKGLTSLSEKAREADALFIVAVAEPISLGILIPPGQYGADVVVGEGQSFGIPASFGGPHLGLFATSSALVRQMPGRLVGETVDMNGARGFVLTLATREQHIRRERATSNICTNQSLCALAATIYLSLLGPKGLAEVAGMNIKRSREAAEKIDALPGYEVLQERCFNEFVVRTPVPPEKIDAALAEKDILGGIDLSRFDARWKDLRLLCCTEMTSEEDIEALVEALREVTS